MSDSAGQPNATGRHDRGVAAWLAWTATVIAVAMSFVAAPYPRELVLQHVPTVVALVAIAVTIRRRWLGSLSLGCLFLFWWLHIVGARWIYSYVPYDAVIQSMTGTTLTELFGWQRNHYDRLVHFASGCLGVPIASELLRRIGGMRWCGSLIMGIACVLAVGAVYEILEWLLAVTLSPAAAEAYNGQQGDAWDAQKDLALAGLGAMAAALVFVLAPTILGRPSRGSHPKTPSAPHETSPT
ncbi:MAG: DUF2238 domain-containing protein [Planctomycetota bacterium]